MVKVHPIYMIFGQVMTIFKVNPDPDPHFLFLCKHGASHWVTPHLAIRSNLFVTQTIIPNKRTRCSRFLNSRQHLNIFLENYPSFKGFKLTLPSGQYLPASLSTAKLRSVSPSRQNFPAGHVLLVSRSASLVASRRGMFVGESVRITCSVLITVVPGLEKHWMLGNF